MIATVVLASILMFSGLNSAISSTPTNADLTKRLQYCGSIPNGASLTVVETTRFSFFLPKDIYPTIKLIMKSNGATANYFSNAGAYGYAQNRGAKSGCWSYAFDFELTPNNKSQSGTVDIASKSAYKGVSNYLIHFKVVVNPPSATKKIAGNGNVVGHVLLGPVCPVERIPPDPACAPRPFKTTINVWSMWTGSSYQPVPTDANGTFKLSLAPGKYSLTASNPTGGSLYPRCTQITFSVVAKKTQNVTVNCDTGIR